MSVAQWVPRYSAYGPELLENSRFESGLDGWRVSRLSDLCRDSSADICLENSSHEKSVSVSQDFSWPAAQQYLVLAADLKGQGLEPGQRSWHFGRLVLARYDEKGRWLSLPHYVAALEGSSRWRSYAEPFRFNPRTVQTKIQLQLPHATGRLAARNLSLKAARPNPLFPVGQFLVFILSGVWLLWLFRPRLTSGHPVLIRIGLLLVVVGILFGTLMPGALKKEVTGQADRLVSELGSPQPGIEQPQRVPDSFHWSVDTDKAFHFGGFLLLGLFLSALSSTRFAALLDGLLLAMTTELLQMFVAGRTPLFTDVLVDASGVLVGAALWALAGAVGLRNAGLR